MYSNLSGVFEQWEARLEKTITSPSFIKGGKQGCFSSRLQGLFGALFLTEGFGV